MACRAIYNVRDKQRIVMGKTTKRPLIVTLALLFLLGACQQSGEPAETTFASNRDQGEVVDNESQKNIFRIAQGSAVSGKAECSRTAGWNEVLAST